MTASHHTQQELFGQPQNELIDTAEARHYLGISPRTFFAWKASGTLPVPTRSSGRRGALKFLWSRHELDSVKPTAERRRRLKLDVDFFADVRSPAQAYLLGFLAGDGCVSDDGVISVTLADKDIDHLAKIRDVLGSDAPIRTPGDSSACRRIAFCSLKMASDLARQGIGPRKSLTLEAWSGPEELLPSYYLGLIDADGCWHRGARPPGSFSWALSLIGSLPSMQGFIRFLRRRINCEPRLRPKTAVWTVGLSGGERLQALARILYADSPICLDRKKELVGELLGWKRRVRDFSGLTAEGIRGAYDELGTWQAVAHRLGIDPSNLNRIKRRLGIPIGRA